jgi:hypothetical protein
MRTQPPSLSSESATCTTYAQSGITRGTQRCMLHQKHRHRNLSFLDIDPADTHVLWHDEVVPVTVDEYSLEGQYACPVYVKMQRANVYSPLVSVFTLQKEAPQKWVVASVALLLQDELS